MSPREKALGIGEEEERNKGIKIEAGVMWKAGCNLTTSFLSCPFWLCHPRDSLILSLLLLQITLLTTVHFTHTFLFQDSSILSLPLLTSVGLFPLLLLPLFQYDFVLVPKKS